MLADSREPELVIATAQDGLLAFNGRAFRQIFPQDASARTITSVLPTASGHLLIGTRKRGVLLYDGQKITVLHPTLAIFMSRRLAGTESDLWVGTLNQGVLHWHAGETDSFGEHAGLPDPQVQSIAVAGDKTYVGTVLGVAVFERGRFSRILAAGSSGRRRCCRAPVSCLVGSEDQGVIAIPLEEVAGPIPGSGGHIRELARSPASCLAMGDAVFAMTRSGLYRMNCPRLWLAARFAAGRGDVERS